MDNVLIGFSLCWIAMNCLRGLQLGFKHEAHGETLLALIKEKKFEAYEQTRNDWQWKSAVHAHATLLSLVALAVGIILPQIIGSDIYKIILCGLLMVAPVLWSIFGYWFNKPLLGLGDFCFAIGIFMSAIGFVRGMI